MRQKTRSSRCAYPVLLLGMALATAAWAAPVRTTPGVVPPNSRAYGRTYAEWAAAEWQWVMGLPVSQNPCFDPSETPANPLNGQTEKVLFSPGAFGVASATRRLAIPSGHPLMFPIGCNNADNYSVYPRVGPETLMEWARANTDGITPGPVTIDGREVRDLPAYRVSGFGVYYIPETDNIWQQFGYSDVGGWYEFAHDGYWIMIAPLPIGQHVVNTSFRWSYPEYDPPIEGRQDVTFVIDVVPAGQFKK